MISNAAFAQLMQQINLPSAAAEYDRFALYCTQLQEWNQRMNLTAITDDEGVAEKHFADSLLPLTMVQLPVGASLVDVGSGAEIHAKITTDGYVVCWQGDCPNIFTDLYLTAYDGVKGQEDGRKTAYLTYVMTKEE